MPAGNNVTVKQYPMFWTWLDYRPGMNFDSVCQVMNDIGMDGIMLNAPPRRLSHCHSHSP